jgi:TonB-dependent starch-binding outer membrane protein SusC
MKRVLLMLALIALTSMSVFAQSRTITGKVTSADEPEGIPGVNVLVKGTTVGTVTDLNGNYRITLPDGGNTLVFSFIGYLKKEVAVGNTNSVNVSLDTDIKNLSEVVVVGYGTQERSGPATFE